MGVFSVNTIKESKTKDISTPSEFGSIDIYGSFFEQSLDLILDETKTFETLLCKEISVSEGFIGDLIIDYAKNKIKMIDPTEIFSNIFDWFISAFEKLGKSFCAFLLNFVNRDAQLSLYKKKLGLYRGSVRYTKPYFEYRNLEYDSSYTSYKIEVENVYNNLNKKLLELSDAKSLTDVSTMVERIKDNSEYNEEYISELRGKVLGLNKLVSMEEYPDALFNYYRTSELPVSKRVGMFEKNIDGNRIRQAYNAYYSASKQESSINKDIMKTKLTATAQKAKIRTINPNKYLSDGMKMNPQILGIYNNIVVNSCRTVKAICDVYVMLFSAKLDALKEYNITNREILLLAIKQIVKEG